MRRVEFPFVTGQQEGVDPKIMPVGTLSAARNVMVRKDGSLVRRRALVPVSTGLPVGEIEGSPREVLRDGALLYEMDDKVGNGLLLLTKHGQNGTLVDGGTLVGKSDHGEMHGDPPYVPEGEPYSPVSPFVGVRETLLGANLGGYSRAPQVGVAANGCVVTMVMKGSQSGAPEGFGAAYGHGQGTRIVVELRDPDTMRVAHSYTLDLRDVEDTYVTEARLVVSKNRPLAAVFFVRRTLGEGDTIGRAAFSTEAPFGVYETRTDTTVSGDTVTGLFADVTPSDVIVFAYGRSDSFSEGTTRIRAWSWDALIQANPSETASAILDNDTEEIGSVYGVFAGRLSEFLVIVGIADGGFDVVVCQVPGSWGDPLEANVVSGGTGPWGDNIVRVGAAWDAAGDRWNIVVTGAELDPPTTAEHDTSSCFFDGATLTVERTFCGVSALSSPVCEGGARWFAAEVVTGTAQEFWLPNYESGIQLIELSRGLVVAQLSRRTGSDRQNPAVGTAFARLSSAGNYYVVAETLLTASSGLGSAIWAFRRGAGMMVQTRDGEIAVAGGVVCVSDGCDAGPCGFTAAPEILSEYTGPLPDGEPGEPAGYFLASAVLEHTDANGRLWRSAPATPQQLVARTFSPNLLSATCGKGAPSSHEVIVAYYLSGLTPAPDPVPEPGELVVSAATVLYRTESGEISQGTGDSVGDGNLSLWNADVSWHPTDETAPDEPDQDQAVLYTDGGVLGNDAPPAADFLCVHANRLWAAGLPERSKIQASKQMVPELGIEWSNDDTFFLSFPEEVIGLASVDETLMVFTTRGVYLVSGAGPDNRGIGEFYSSQRLPGTRGCVSARSIVVSDLGVFYQTARGIEIVGRGFGGASWIGQGVRDQVDRLPYCWGATALPDGTVRFLMGGGETTGESALLVWDQRSAGWYVYTYSATEIQGGRAGLGETFGRMTLCDWSTGQVRREGDSEFSSDEPAYIETGWLRPAGINSDHVGRRLNLLGQFLGPTGRAEVDVAVAFDDRPYDPNHVRTYVIEAGDGRNQYRPGDPIELELTLPKMHFSSARAKVTWRKLGGAAESVALSGLTMFVEANPGGQRVGTRSKN